MGMYPYSFLFVHCDWLRSVESMVGSMLPHQIGVVSDEPTVLHPTGQSEAQVHPDMVVQGAVIGGGVGAERAIPVCHLPLYDPAFVHKGTALFNLFGGSWADNIIQPDVPVSSIVRVAGVDNLALDTTKDINDILTFDQPSLGALRRDSHHSFFLQDIVPCFYGLRVFAGLQVLVVLASGYEVSFSGIAPVHGPESTFRIPYKVMIRVQQLVLFVQASIG